MIISVLKIIVNIMTRTIPMPSHCNVVVEQEVRRGFGRARQGPVFKIPATMFFVCVCLGEKDI